jgi:uncharacterized membrane protein YeiB
MSELHTAPPAAGLGDVGPVTARERIVLLDILRGIALLGVVVANVWFWFSGVFPCRRPRRSDP